MCQRDQNQQQQQQQTIVATNTTTMDASFVPYRVASSYLKEKLLENGMTMPTVGIICGSGLSGLSETLREPTMTVKYEDIPGFPSHTTVKGHKGEVVFGSLGGGVSTVCFRGRFHSYEGHDMKTVVLPVNIMRCLGAKMVIVTNAAGGLNPDYSVGDVICVSDHLAIPQLAGKNSLVGPNDDELGPRFPATSDAYPENLRKAACVAAEELQFDFVRSHGTYCFVSGPMYESKAECRFLRSLGGDCVGMSTVPEIVAAHHCNMRALCLSLVTNKVVMSGDEGEAVANHAEVLQAVDKRSTQMQALVERTVAILRRDVLPKLPPLRQVSLLVPDDQYEYHRRQREESSPKSKMRTMHQDGTLSSDSSTSGLVEMPATTSTSAAAAAKRTRPNSIVIEITLTQLVVGFLIFLLGGAVGSSAPSFSLW